ncbi:hypothetical protein NXF25_002139 [Crotalus adamanteus]|uniref:Uncharacterized protein n=1 Tax=Crotalus adamanteus TaxID=8729 RepID=A0AAW1C8Z9_CROAD
MAAAAVTQSSAAMAPPPATTVGRLPLEVAKYTQEFHELACQLATWPEKILNECFKDGLNDEVYHTCISRGPSRYLQQ